jgi:hypothetical protein
MRTKKYLILICAIILSVSCRKFLDEKQDRKLVVPSTLKDLQSLLDDPTRVNQFSPGMAAAASDDGYLPAATYQSLSESERRLYTWQKTNVNPRFPNDWSYGWGNIYRANTVLHLLPSVTRTTLNQTLWDNVRGQALCVRGRYLQEIAYAWCQAYDPVTAATDLGLPLRLDPDFNMPSVRSSLEDTYRQIEADLKAAIPLLPVTPLHVMRFSKPAAYALMARLYWSMRSYEKAGAYADSCLALYNTLLDFNNLSASATFPLPRFNAEVIWHCTASLHETNYSGYSRVDSSLYALYADGDLRKQAFFNREAANEYSFKGGYDGSIDVFDGISTNEVYLVLAECQARAGNRDAALATLNKLMINRWKKTSFVPLSAPDAATALTLVLTERRKELPFRNLRWIDVKRLNKEGANISMKRVIGTEVYTLQPNDPGFALPIPDDVIAISGMKQNP